MVSQQVSNWLFNVIQPLYEHKKEVYAHVFQFLQLHLKKILTLKLERKSTPRVGQESLIY